MSQRVSTLQFKTLLERATKTKVHFNKQGDNYLILAEPYRILLHPTFAVKGRVKYQYDTNLNAKSFAHMKSKRLLIEGLLRIEDVVLSIEQQGNQSILEVYLKRNIIARYTIEDNTPECLVHTQYIVRRERLDIDYKTYKLAEEKVPYHLTSLLKKVLKQGWHVMEGERHG